MSFIHEEVWFYLSAIEYKVLMFIIMRTIRFHKKEEAIPLSHFLGGVWGKEDIGKCYMQALVGEKAAHTLGKTTLYKAFDRLEKLGLIKRTSTGRATIYAPTWRPGIAAELHFEKFGCGRNFELRKGLNKYRKIISEKKEDAPQACSRRREREVIFSEGGVCIERTYIEYPQTHIDDNMNSKNMDAIYGAQDNNAYINYYFNYYKNGKWDTIPRNINGEINPMFLQPIAGLRILPKPNHLQKASANSRTPAVRLRKLRHPKPNN